MANTIVIISTIAFFIYGIYVSRNISVSDYASFRGKATSNTILLSILSSLVGGWMFFGLSAIGYEAGIVGVFIGVGYCIGLLIFSKYIPIIKKLMQDTNSDSLDELIGKKYGKKAQTAVTSINYLFFVSVLAAQFIALQSFIQLFSEQLNPTLIYWIVAITVILYTAVSGFKGVLFTDRWQFILITIAVVFIIFFGILFNQEVAIKPLDTSYYLGTRYGVGFVVAVLLFFPFTILARADLWQRISSAKNANDAQRAILIAIPILLMFYIVLAGIGMYARATLGADVDPATSGLLLFSKGISSTLGSGILNTLISSVLFVGIISALISTIDTNLNVISIATSKLISSDRWDLYNNGDNSNKKLLSSMRLITIIVGMISLIFAIYIPNIVDIIVGAGAMILILLPSVWFLVKKGSTHIFTQGEKIASFWSLILGFVTLLVLLIYFDPKTAFLPAAIISIVIFTLLIQFGRFKNKKFR